MFSAIILSLNLVSLPIICGGGKIGGGLGAYCLDDTHCFDSTTVCVNETCVCDIANSYVEVGAGGGGELLRRTARDELGLLDRKERGISASCLKDCGNPTASTGYVIDSIEATYEGSNAVLSCDTGYNGMGGTIACQADGTWEAFSGCLIDCGSPTATTGYTLGSVTTTTDGSTVDVSCDSGYGGLGGTITCQSSGSWSVATGCSADCGTPTSSTGYTLTHVISTLAGDKVPFVCDSRASYCGHAGTIECLSSGSWSSFHGCNHDVTLCSAGNSYEQPAAVITMSTIAALLTFI